MRSHLFAALFAALTFCLCACGSDSNTRANVTLQAGSSNAGTPQPAPSLAAAANEYKTDVAQTAEPNAAGGKREKDEVEGDLQVGKTDSVLVYVGMDTGDYAAYCFTNNSAAGKTILAACKADERCRVTGTIDHEVRCEVPGLEADLSASGRILTADSVKVIARKR